MLFLLLAIVSVSLSNARRASAKGLNPGVWGGLTSLMFIAGLFLACTVLCFIILVQHPAMMELVQKNDRAMLGQMVNKLFEQHDLLYVSLIFGGGFGGYLIVRYLLERKKPLSDTQ
ncbi:hypothetical protein [Rurimicrobium arvi]|uniref:DUF4199 domain-containing protein n=1 Tax=Rurimicrobium arvi TaxID=2049916 RepID=A0ABP8MTT5_9BACT